ncbi:class D beta-lactamase [Maribacter halichondriae]|uniref:class D beta-lactamase n=1 Tax=Maribacter halichondriae TaxID=2980554 RepID=UPI00235931A9|nr:class D beta-lactamase [Maribacter sp. Hal144]
MKSKYLVLLSIVLFSCANEKRNQPVAKSIPQKQVKSSEFQSILDQADVVGTLLIYDLENKTFYSNDFKWADTGKLPASTFKIINSIIALETGVVESDSTMFTWDGQQRGLKIWEQDLIFRDAFHFSCVPCYQDVARSIGSERMNSWLRKLDYGTMKVDADNIDMFWLEGASRISPFQQIDFLNRFYKNELPIAPKTHAIMKKMMVIEKSQAYTLRGKTGWSIYKGNNNGWFIGYVETEKGTYFFAANVEPKGKFQQATFVSARKDVVYNALKQLKIID